MLPDRYTLQNLKKVIQEPRMLGREMKRLTETAVVPIANYYWQSKYGNGVDVMMKDWDNLLILDACRYDYFYEQNQIDGDLSAVVSKGSYSWEFMTENFQGRELHDTIYVTANPYADGLSEDTFYTVESVLNQWDDELQTVLPEDVVRRAIDIHEQHPHKRLIVHFMQPHQPWIGPTAEKIRDRFEIKGWDNKHGPDEKLDGKGQFEVVRDGSVTESEMKQAYRESLDIVLDYAENLISSVNGKSVITSDHGELLQERIIPITPYRYGHPPELKAPKLRTVPWLEIAGSERRHITAEQPIGFDMSDEKIEERLKALGYA